MARSAFAEHGYDRATIRLIAGEADVDPALVHHYFGTKEDLFAAAVDIPFNPGEALQAIFAGGVEGAGEWLARLFFTIWEGEASRRAMLGQLRRALTAGAEPSPLAEFVTRAVLPRITPHLGGPDRELRAELAASQLLGLAILRYVVRMEPVASTPVERLIEQVAPRIQSYLAGSVDGRTATGASLA
ncbi:MAG: TetR family transcriptional regulator [Acidimicrobiia bacterium]